MMALWCRLSFHASEPAGGGFELTNSRLGNIVGSVECHVQDSTATYGAFTGMITKGPQKGTRVTVYLEDATPTDPTTGDTFELASAAVSCNQLTYKNLANPDPRDVNGSIDIR